MDDDKRIRLFSMLDEIMSEIWKIESALIKGERFRMDGLKFWVKAMERELTTRRE